MTVISLQYKVKIDQRVQNEYDQKFKNSLNEYVAGLPARIITARKIESWQVFKKGYPQEYKEMLEYISTFQQRLTFSSTDNFSLARIFN